MAKYLIQEETLASMADAARSFTGKSATLTATEMAEYFGREFITFHVTGNLSETHLALDGMTWGEWCKSRFATGTDYSIASNNFIYNASVQIMDPNGNFVSSSDVIIADESYFAYVCCFVAGTQVLVSLDGKSKNIEDILEGDTVVSYNTETGENYLAFVHGTVINTHSTRMAHVVFADKTVLEMTDYHPIYTTEGFKSITDPKYKKLVVGDMAKTTDGWNEIVSITQYTLAEPIWTYTLRVVDAGESPDNDTNDNYYANGIVVHNAGCPS